MPIMNRRLRSLIIVIALMGLQALSASGQHREDDADRRIPSCEVRLYIDEQGTTTASVDILLEKPVDLELEQVEEALRQGLGTSLGDVERTKTRTRATVHGRADRAFPAHGGQIEGELDMAPLGRLVHPLGMETIEVRVMLSPTYPDRSRPLKGRMQFYSVLSTSPEPIEFVLQTGPPGWARPVTILATVFLAPILVVLWRRWVTLRAESLDPAVRWYRFWRWVHWITLATWLVWITVIPTLEMTSLLWRSVSHNVGTVLVAQFVAMLVPPGLVMVLCNALSEEVFGRLTKAPQTVREIFWRTGLVLITTWFPLSLAIIGFFALAEGSLRVGVLWLVSAGAMRVVGSWLLSGREDLSPHAVTAGELRDRIFVLAREAGVSLKQLYVVPTRKTPQANAFAVKGGNVLITDHLLRNLSRREVDAIAAHELAHLKYRHPTWLTGLFFAALFVPGWVLQPLVPFWWQLSWMHHVPVGVLFAFGLLYFVSRRFEYQTDAYAAWLTGDPEALITGLIKVHRLNLLPMKWGRWEEGLVTHPSTSLRLEAIARQNGISRQRLQEIVDHAEQGGEHYSMPEAVSDRGLVFSTGFKIKWMNRISYARVAAMLLTPTLVGYMAWNVQPDGIVKWAICLGGVALTFVVVVVLDNFVPLWSYAEVRRGLEEKMKAQGIDSSAWSGVLVSFAPDPTPRLYENHVAWDFGFLFVQGGQLFYVGEQTRFALQREHVVRVYLGRGVSRWWPVPFLYIAWKDKESGTVHTFNLRAAQVSSMRQLKRETMALERNLKRWFEQPAPAGETAPLLSQLCPPCIGEVTSAPVQFKYSALVFQTGLVLLLGIGVSLCCGLPYNPEESGWTWYVPVVATLTFWFETLPLFIAQHRDAHPQDSTGE